MIDYFVNLYEIYELFEINENIVFEKSFLAIVQLLAFYLICLESCFRDI